MPDANLYTILRCGFAGRMDAVALVVPGGEEWTWAQLDERSARYAAVLAARGVGPGDRVVLQAPKSLEVVALYLACLRRGAVIVPLNTAYTDAEVRRFVADAEPRLFVGERQRTGAGVPFASLGEGGAGDLADEACAARPLVAVEPRAADDLAAIVYTSGTTGVSKGAMLSHGNLASNAATLAQLWGMRANDVLLHALPVYHVHGLFVALHTAMLAGAATLFLPRFDAVAVRALLPRATVMMGVPTFYTRLLALDGFGREDCRSMRLFISGSAPLLASTWEEFRSRTGHAILERYGMTETGMITSNPLEGVREPGTVGFALPGVDVRIVGDDGAPAACGEAGVLHVRGPNVFAGYWRMPERTAAEFREGGWFVTGDVAVADAEGRVTLVGRARDLIISGGLNIYPKEIEDVLDAVAGVAETAVVGMPDPDFGEVPAAFVVREPGAAVDEATLREAAATALARFKHPRAWFFVEELPRNAMGKVQKNLLRHTAAGRGE